MTEVFSRRRTATVTGHGGKKEKYWKKSKCYVGNTNTNTNTNTATETGQRGGKRNTGRKLNAILDIQIQMQVPLSLCLSFSLSLPWLVVDSLKWFNPQGSVSGSATMPAGRVSPPAFKASNGFVRVNSNRFPNKVQIDLCAHLKGDMLEDPLEKPATTFEAIKQRHFDPNPRFEASQSCPNQS